MFYATTQAKLHAKNAVLQLIISVFFSFRFKCDFFTPAPFRQQFSAPILGKTVFEQKMCRASRENSFNESEKNHL